MSLRPDLCATLDQRSFPRSCSSNRVGGSARGGFDLMKGSPRQTQQAPWGRAMRDLRGHRPEDFFCRSAVRARARGPNPPRSRSPATRPWDWRRSAPVRRREIRSRQRGGAICAGCERFLSWRHVIGGAQGDHVICVVRTARSRAGNALELQFRGREPRHRRARSCPSRQLRSPPSEKRGWPRS
jgi:hypothetical protein